MGPNQDYTLNVSATDGDISTPASQRSGVTSLTATLDGQPMTGGSAAAPCTRPEGSCALNINATLTGEQIADLDDTIEHTVAITAVDALNHPKTETFTFRVDSVAPSSFSDGGLAQLSGRTLTEDSYRMRVEARDNQPFQGERGDFDDETPTIFEQAGAGLRNLVIRLDGQPVTTTPTACFDDAECEDARVWQWDTANAVNGTHQITVTAADDVDNQEVDTFQIELQRAADRPPAPIAPCGARC